MVAKNGHVRVLPPHRRGKGARARVQRVQRVQRESLARNDLKSWQRATAVLNSMDGATRAASAERLGVDASTVSRWVGGYRERGEDRNVRVPALATRATARTRVPRADGVPSNQIVMSPRLLRAASQLRQFFTWKWLAEAWPSRAWR